MGAAGQKGAYAHFFSLDHYRYGLTEGQKAQRINRPTKWNGRKEKVTFKSYMKHTIETMFCIIHSRIDMILFYEGHRLFAQLLTFDRHLGHLARD